MNRLGGITIVWIFAPLLAAAAAGAVIWYFGFHGSSTPVTTGTRQLPHVTAAQVLRNGSRWRGRKVVLVGEFGRKYGPHSFTLDVSIGSGAPGNRGVLVVAQSVPDVAGSATLHATGTVERLSSQSGGLPVQVTGNVLRSFRGSFVLVAGSVSKT